MSLVQEPVLKFRRAERNSLAAFAFWTELRPAFRGHKPERKDAIMTTAREHLIAWLRDAHAMEEQAKSLLETQIKRLKSYPSALPRLQEHLDETERQRAAVEECLRELGSDTSTLKDLSTKMMATMQGFTHMMSSDEILKHALANHAFERFEAASYRSLAAAADAAGEPRIAETARRILAEEERMGNWVWDQIPILTEEYIQRTKAGQEAKI
jgi:ferritin-like metal-binding protein YciE